MTSIGSSRSSVTAPTKSLRQNRKVRENVFQHFRPDKANDKHFSPSKANDEILAAYPLHSKYMDVEV
jgi:hypothetical protein